QRTHQPRESQARHEPEEKNEHGREQHGKGDDDDIDHERDTAARQHAFEQLRVGGRVVGMGLDVNRHADLSRSAVGHDQMSSRAVLAMLDSTSGRSIDGLCARGTAICEMTRECGLVSRMRSSALTADPPGGGPKRAAPAAGGRRGMSITIADIQGAGRTTHGQVLRTPMLPAPKLSALTAAEVYVKYENLQVTNSFKDRGALNKLASQSGPERGRGVIAMSAGNHAQAVAYHAARLAIP